MKKSQSKICLNFEFYVWVELNIISSQNKNVTRFNASRKEKLKRKDGAANSKEVFSHKIL